MQLIKCSGCKHLKNADEFQEGYKTCETCLIRQAEIRQTDTYKERKNNYYIDHKEEAKVYGFNYRRTIVGRFNKIKAAAERMTIRFNLSIDQYSALISKPCYYCDGFFPPVLAGSGLDRLNPKKGYTIKNSVSCCDTCNTLKNDIFSPEETKAAVEAIIKVRKKIDV